MGGGSLKINSVQNRNILGEMSDMFLCNKTLQIYSIFTQNILW